MAKQKFKITNWPTYNKALINRGSITFWLDDEAIQAWYESATPSSRGRPQRYSDLAITTVLVIKRVFRLTLRAAQGFIDSIFSLMNVPLRCPDYSCVSRRAKSVNISFKTPTRGEIAHLVIDSTGLKVFGEGEWKVKIINKGYSDPAKWHSEDTVWVLGLFGTAIGAGVLFLPINAGIGGFWPLLIVFVLAFPITYLAHRGLARFIYSSNTPESSITDVIGEHFGALAGKVFTVIYFFAVYTILIMYAVAITNTAQSFITHQLAMAEPPRSLVAIVLILGLMFIVRFGQRLIMRVMSTLVYPFIISLIFMALFLIPHWNGAILQTVSFSATGDGQGIMLSLWMTFPVLVMSFNHYPIISPMVVRQKQRYGLALAEGKCAQIQRYGILLMTVVVLFFVLSCVLSLSPQQLAEAKAQNLSILSYLANQYDTPIIAWLSPIIAFVAITKSFLGHYIGAYESLRDLILEAAAARGKKPGIRLVDAVILVFMVLTCWFAAYKNPSILGIIECISGPTGAAILLLLPMYAIHKLPVLAPWRGKASNVFVTLIGLITVSAIFYGMFQ